MVKKFVSEYLIRIVEWVLDLSIALQDENRF